MKAEKITIPYTPHPGQVPFHTSTAQTRILACGRRWGKDRASIAETVMLVARFYAERVNNPKYRTLVPLVHVWVVAPILELTRQNWEELLFFLKHFPPGVVTRTNETNRLIELWGGAVKIELKSADSPEKLVSVGLDILVITEAGIIDDKAYEESLAPALVSPGRAGLAIINGTPKGTGSFFHKLYMMGIDPDNPDVWAAGTVEAGPSGYDNPYQDKRALDRLAARMPERLRKQEIYCFWLGDEGAVFRKIAQCATGMLEDPQRGRGYVMGVDLARYHDWTVLCVMDEDRHTVVAYERFNMVDWHIQKQRIKVLARRYYNAKVVMDSTNQESVLEDLVAMGVDVEGYHFTGASKRELINNLIVGFDTVDLSFPPIPQLLFELKTFTYKRSKAGNLKTEAPAGEEYFDDWVTALGLAYWLCAIGQGHVAEPVTVASATPQLGLPNYVQIEQMFGFIAQEKQRLRDALERGRRAEAGEVEEESEEEELEPTMVSTATIVEHGQQMLDTPWWQRMLGRRR